MTKRRNGVRDDGCSKTGRRSGLSATGHAGQSGRRLSGYVARVVRLVDEKALPAGLQIKGMVVWDRLELDAAFENFKSGKHKPRNSADEALGINTDDADD